MMLLKMQQQNIISIQKCYKRSKNLLTFCGILLLIINGSNQCPPPSSVHGFFHPAPTTISVFQRRHIASLRLLQQRHRHHVNDSTSCGQSKQQSILVPVVTTTSTVIDTKFQTSSSSSPKVSFYHALRAFQWLCLALTTKTISSFHSVKPTWAATTAVISAATSTTPITTTSISTITTSTMDTLGITNIGLAATLVLITSGLGLHLISGVPKLSRDIIQSCLRSSVQLLFFGGTVLTQLLIAGQTRPWLVWSWIALTAMIAANEAYHRVEYTYPQLPYHLIASFLLGGGFMIGMTVALRILGPVRPWYTPRVWIPVAGMMLGNALTGTALAAKTVTKEFAINADQMELRLTQGATWREAIHVPLQTIYTTSLTPLMNFLSAAGIVHVPGLMTGQILAGQSPLQAATYQMLVFMLMASTTSTAVQIFVRFAITSLVDQRNDRLQLGALQRVGKSIGYKRNSLLALISTIPQLKLRTRIRLRRIFFRKGSKNRSHKLEKINGSGYGNEINRKKQQLASYYPQMPVYSVALNQTMSTLNMNRPPPILSIDQMRVARTNMDVTLDVGIGDRIALTGQSGIGKSQVLRTLAGLELVDRNAIHLFHVSAAKMSMADWRSHVVLVPQQRPSLEGTPNDFYNQVLQFSSQRKKNQEQNVTFISPSEYGKKWGVAATLFDRPWSKLSGGESQRIVLAIALSMQPDVLLLDESTSALDESTEILVEDTIKDLRIPVIMVSHSGTQIDRFCNQRLSLERTASIGTFPTRVSLV